MINKINLFLQLFAQYGFQTFKILAAIRKKKPFTATVYNQEILFNADSATIHHLLNSIDKMKKMVDTATVPDNAIVLDIGANIGLFSAFLVKKQPSATVYAFEPYKKILPILEHNTAAKNVTIVKSAVTNHNGQVSFFTSDASDQTGSLIEDNVRLFGEKSPTKVTIDAMTLDHFLAQHNIDKVDLLKIDIQGEEYKALSNNPETLRKIDQILVEVILTEEDSIPLLNLLSEYYPYQKAINSIIYGADLLFSRTPID